jgi:hypothetical protein
MAKKKSGSKASTIAGRVLAELAECNGRRHLTAVLNLGRDEFVSVGVTVAEVRTLAASVLSQDEKKGQGKRARRRK